MPCPRRSDPSPGCPCQCRGALTGSPGNATLEGFSHRPPRPGQEGPCCNPSATSALLGTAGITGQGWVTAEPHSPYPPPITPLCRDPETPLPDSVQRSRAHTRGKEFGEGEAVIPAQPRHRVALPGTGPLSPGGVICTL